MFGSTAFASRPFASAPLGSDIPTSFDVQPLPLPAELPQLFLANWLNGMIVNSAFETDLFLAEDQTEDRVARTTIPHREMITTFTGMGRDESQELFLLALKGALERLPIPLPSDTAFLTAAALTTDTTINCDTTSRRIYKGARILIFDLDFTGIPIKQSFNRISSFTDTTITFVDPIGFAYPINSLVIPLIDCHLNINQSGSFITDYNFNLPYTYREVEGPSSLPRMALSANYILHRSDSIIDVDLFEESTSQDFLNGSLPKFGWNIDNKAKATKLDVDLSTTSALHLENTDTEEPAEWIDLKREGPFAYKLFHGDFEVYCHHDRIGEPEGITIGLLVQSEINPGIWIFAGVKVTAGGAALTLYGRKNENNPTSTDFAISPSAGFGNFYVQIRRLGDNIHIWHGGVTPLTLTSESDSTLLNLGTVTKVGIFISREPSGTGTLSAFSNEFIPTKIEFDPIFFPTHDWLTIPSISVRRPGTQFSSGNATVITTRGSKSEVDFTIAIKALTRVEAIDIISLFEDRLGRAKIFWFVNLLNIWDVTAITTTTIDVDKSSSLALILSEIEYVGVVTRSGAIQIRTIDTVVDISGIFRITLTAALSPVITLAEVAKVAPAYKVRFAEDGLTETWSTDQTCSMDLKFKELINEASIPLEAT